MRIAIDARYLKADFSGIGAYSENLLEALAKADAENEYVVIVHSSYRGELVLGENFEVVEDDALPVSMRTMLTLQSLVRRHGADALHSLFPMAPLAWRGKLLVTVHDLQPLLDPEFTGMRPRPQRLLYDLFYRYCYPASMKKADFLICDSYATKRYLVRLFPQFADKILVVHAAIGKDALILPAAEEIDRVRQKYSIPERFLFYLGSTRPNKNLHMMLDAFEDFIRRHPEQDDLHWVLVVKTDRFFDPLFARIREKNLLRRVHIHEQIGEMERNVFYHLAEMLLFVTKFEGFGLPILEAQAQGLPVLTSTHSSLPEIAGNSAILADPDDVESIVDGLESFYAKPEEKKRLIEAGKENLKRFSWAKAAKEITDMYNHLLS